MWFGKKKKRNKRILWVDLVYEGPSRILAKKRGFIQNTIQRKKKVLWTVNEIFTLFAKATFIHNYNFWKISPPYRMSQCSWLVLKNEIKVRFSGLGVLVHTVFLLFYSEHWTELNFPSRWQENTFVTTLLFYKPLSVLQRRNLKKCPPTIGSIVLFSGLNCPLFHIATQPHLSRHAQKE